MSSIPSEFEAYQPTEADCEAHAAYWREVAARSARQRGHAERGPRTGSGVADHRSQRCRVHGRGAPGLRGGASGEHGLQPRAALSRAIAHRRDRR